MTAIAVAILSSDPHLTGPHDQSWEEVARMEVMRYADEAYEIWKITSASPCPSSLYVLNEYVNKRDIRDPWGRDYLFTCDPKTRELVVFSYGEDGRPGNSDDIRSDE